ncbi:protein STRICTOSIDINE SYNTHASE-LIKE 5-like isoform X2 [Lycium ferocissimum]|uniref:protein STRICTOSIDINE SYNTHASE-LIKE 5-like isoform X2 n=1 Tax=Lycium ferocissimum TaxID=112874 RepID=UPI0028165B7F|nr:protein STRICTOSIDINE SYNTHASE-LIKE 5-like isoform X2 [Lycium ferocissimum]
MHPLLAISSFLVVIMVAISLQVLFYSPISPEILEIPSSSKTFTTTFTSNNYLQRVKKLGEGFLDRPEDVAVDKMGILYTATRDGWIKRRHKNGTWESWRYIGRDSLLGLEVSSAGHIIVCDTEKGLLKVSEDGVSVLASHVNGERIRFADAVVEASDGNLYFSSASTKFGHHDWYLDVLEAKPHGQLLKYNPSSNHTSVLLDNLAFANGVALSTNQDYLIVCETWKCLKFWLKDKIKGKTEIFVDNLPGAPDNIKLAPDGSFWIALIELSARELHFVHKSRATKHLLATFPKLINWVNGAYHKAMVVNVRTDGKIIKGFDDPIGKVMSLVTSVLEFENHLYLGSLNCDFIGMLPLAT